ncbi:helix-turn-helix transcriptional regulator [Enterobacter vonholyi]
MRSWENPVNGMRRLDDVAPLRFHDSEYYRRYFQRNIVEDEVQVNLLLDERRMMCLSLGSARRFSNHDIGFLHLAESWLLPLMRQHTRFENARAEVTKSPFMATLSGAEGGVLTGREIEVTRLMLSGCSTKEIARRMSISVETVRAHKKHLYAKLKVKTQSELFLLFWQGPGRPVCRFRTPAPSVHRDEGGAPSRSSEARGSGFFLTFPAGPLFRINFSGALNFTAQPPPTQRACYTCPESGVREVRWQRTSG